MTLSVRLSLGLLLGSLACTPFANLSQIDTPAANQPVAAPTATSTSLLATPTATVVSTNTPPVTVDAGHLAPFQQAMLPAFSTDVDTVAAAGASRYTIDINLGSANFEKGNGLYLTGTEQIIYTNTEDVPLNHVYFRLYPNLPGYGGQMRVDEVLVQGQPVEPALEAQKTALRVPLPADLLPGQRIAFDLSYQAVVPTGPNQGYNIFSYANGTISLAGFYPALAVYDESGWNIEVPPPYGDATHLDVSLYQVQLTAPSQMVVAASGSLVEESTHSDNTKTLRLVSGPMRDFYLAMSQNFKVASQVVDGTVVNSYYPPHLEQGGQLALQYAVDALRVFNQHFGQYPYAEFDVAATPTTAGGVEYPGIVVISERIYNQEGVFFQHVIAHEVAHQWWYGLVGNNQIDEPWLDESLTNYSTVFYWQQVEGVETARQVIETFFTAPYQRAKTQGRDKAVIGPVENFTVEEYSTFVYGKGPLFFNALRQEVGDDMYFEIMQSYYRQYRYKIASAQNLFTVIEQVSGQNVEPLLETWLEAR